MKPGYCATSAAGGIRGLSGERDEEQVARQTKRLGIDEAAKVVEASKPAPANVRTSTEAEEPEAKKKDAAKKETKAVTEVAPAKEADKLAGTETAVVVSKDPAAAAPAVEAK